MSYRHLPNLYKDQRILMFKEVFALEKIHGSSAHVKFVLRDQPLNVEKLGDLFLAPLISFFSNGRHGDFVRLFDQAALQTAFLAQGYQEISVYGEAYGGKEQGMGKRYGETLRFIAFEVQVGGLYLSVPNAESLAKALGFEFVHYTCVRTDLESLDAERDAPSVQAVRNGITTPQPREGVVLRPLIELTMNNGERIAAKHKRDEERETKTPRKVVSAESLAVLTAAQEIAEEWVTPMRLTHVLGKLGPVSVGDAGRVIAAMVEDVEREAVGEIVSSREARAAIGRKTAELFNGRLKDVAVAAFTHFSTIKVPGGHYIKHSRNPTEPGTE